MNAHAKVEGPISVNMTSKGQVLIPKVVRDRVGLVPGQPVEVGINDRGEAVIMPSRIWPIDPVERRARLRAAIERVAGKHRFGESTDDYMALIRGPYDDLP